MSENRVRQFGLVGYPLSHSFSQQFFSEKFAREKIANCRYNLFPLPSLQSFKNLLKTHTALEGLNVTFPYKEQILPFLHALDEKARQIGAVNVLKIKQGELTGYNTDADGFELSLLRFFLEAGVSQNDLKALVLGTGGASKAIAFVLRQLGIPFQFVSRQKRPGMLTYEELTAAVMAKHLLLVNTTPLGTFPNVDSRPPLPYSLVNPAHLFFDLIYNPEKSLFLRTAEERGCHFKNGLEMLHIQAEKAWEIWNT
jgi:shikimate dehydrogenase